MPRFTFAQDVRLVVDGVYITSVLANTPTDLPPVFENAAYKNGGVISDTPQEPVVAVAPVALDAQDAIRTIANTMRAIMDGGDKTQLTAAGKVRTKVLEAAVGFDTTLEQRDAAEALLEGE